MSSSWENLPGELLLKILEYLKYTDICSVCKTCSKWRLTCNDDILWKHLLQRDYKIHKSRLNDPVCDDWRQEYQRLVDHTPRVCSQVNTDHTDEVLYVSFSRCGQYFVSCSKDGSFIVWNISRDGARSRMIHKQDMTQYNWRYTWAAKFNTTTSLLLVAGVLDDVEGSLAIFQFTEKNEIILAGIFDNNPYDVMGTWCGDSTWMTGNIITRPDFSVDADIRIHRLVSPGPGPGPGSVLPLTNLALKFRYPTNDGSNYFRCLLVSNRQIFRNDKIFPDYSTSFRHSTNIITTLNQDGNDEVFTQAYTDQDVVLIFLCNGHTTTPHQIGFKRLYAENVTNVPVISEADKVIDMHGHIVGIALDTTGKYLYVNMRKWPDGARPAPHLPPPIATEIEMHVLDL